MITAARNRIRRIPWLKAMLLPLAREYGSFLSARKVLSRPLSADLPLNGQERRQEAVSAIMDSTDCAEIIETGTFRGSTTKYLASRYKCPIYTVETNKYFYLYSKLRLMRYRSIRVRYGDSPKLIQERARAGSGEKRAFFYLDAHWYGSPPLRQEVELILSNWREAVICIDDFRVEGDPGYRYDKYENEHLTLEYLRIDGNQAIDLYFPAAPSEQETGKKRGVIYIAVGEATRQRMAALSPRYLRFFSIASQKRD